MESYRKLAFTEEVESILAENNKRLKIYSARTTNSRGVEWRGIAIGLS